jgi:hypothetical protein
MQKTDALRVGLFSNSKPIVNKKKYIGGGQGAGVGALLKDDLNVNARPVSILGG